MHLNGYGRSEMYTSSTLKGHHVFLQLARIEGVPFLLCRKLGLGMVEDERNDVNCVGNGLTMSILRDNITSKFLWFANKVTC